MLYQVRESTDVTLLIDSSQQIQALNVEVSQKNKIIQEMREQLEKLIGVKASVRRDEDIVQSMGNIVKEKDVIIDKLRVELTQAAVS